MSNIVGITENQQALNFIYLQSEENIFENLKKKKVFQVLTSFLIFSSMPEMHYNINSIATTLEKYSVGV